MDMPITQIDSNTLIPIEQHFRVSAGPGAGKTHWLINHIKNVLFQSKRLGKARKISCITYTNVAVETILRDLNKSADSVEVSTIHSFLYKHIVKPYMSFIAAEYDLNIQKVDGHDDIILSNYSFLKEWKEKTKQQRIIENDMIVEAIRLSKWKFDGLKKLICKPDYPQKVNGYSIRNDSYFEYKKMAWERGVLHHDDVLFFSYQLIQKFPFILQILRAKFPYFFIDEFQDTNPIQTQILELIGQDETIVGIIGDRAQSIYSFQGAAPLQFFSFSLSDMVDYQMKDNRRSTNQIINLLNTIRSDIHQKKYKNEEGEKPSLIVGEMRIALNKAQEFCENKDVYSLSRDNITSNAMKQAINQHNIPSDDLLLKLSITDSNNDRNKLIIACIKATEFCRQKRFKEAIKELERLFKDKNDKNTGKKTALKYLNLLLQNYNDFRAKDLFDFYCFVNNNIKTITPLKAGGIKSFYENHTYLELAVCVKITEDISLHRTIHKAKSAEFDNVLLILKDEGDLSFLLNPDLENNEEHRVNYVAVSRAKKRLFISVPAIQNTNRARLNSLLSIIEL